MVIRRASGDDREWFIWNMRIGSSTQRAGSTPNAACKEIQLALQPRMRSPRMSRGMKGVTNSCMAKPNLPPGMMRRLAREIEAPANVASRWEESTWAVRASLKRMTTGLS